jgi:hypothetical protein
MTLFHVAPGLLPQTTGPGWGINLETLLTFEKTGEEDLFQIILSLGNLGGKRIIFLPGDPGQQDARD